MADRNIPFYETTVFSVQDTLDKDKSQGNERKVDITPDGVTVQQSKNVMWIAILILLCAVVAVTTALVVMALERPSGDTTKSAVSDHTATTASASDSSHEMSKSDVGVHTTTASGDMSLCPAGLHFGDCGCGQRTCEDPETCINTCQDGRVDRCIPCPWLDGFYMKGGDCVPQRECGCYAEEEGRVIPEGGAYRNMDCTKKYWCSSGAITSISYNARCDDNAVCVEPDSISSSTVSQCQCGEGYTGSGNICKELARDCQDLYSSGFHDNGVYTIYPTNWTGPAFEAYCNMTDDGGWTVFQRRVDGSVDFYLGWQSYREGFGNLTNEFWLGNEKLYYLTNQKNNQMRIDFVNALGDPYYVEYSYFRIDNEAGNYRLSLGNFSGSVGHDALGIHHRNQQFSTKDRDNDVWIANCAVSFHGAWWYGSCHEVNLNGGYHNSGGTGLRWVGLPGNEYNITYTEMKIRPA